MKVTYIRWSMTIIETEGLTIITDPMFRMFGVRQAPREYTIDRMPRPDMVFISHTHSDHFAPSVLKQLPVETPVWMPRQKARKAAPPGLKGLRGVIEWESDRFRGVRLTAVPAVHRGGELGLVIEGDRTVYFAGDTSLDRQIFSSIGQRWQLDAVILPIGDLRVLGVPVGHINPKKATRALRMLGDPRIIIPTHYSGITIPLLISFGGNPRKLSRAIDRSKLGTLVGTTRPLEVIDF